MDTKDKIIIRNMRIDQFPKEPKPWQFRVDRQSILGNPFPLAGDESKRINVCEKYEIFFHTQLGNNAEFIRQLDLLIERFKEYGKLELYCWCWPKQCHAQTIKDYVFSFSV